MTENDDGAPTRGELLKARADLLRQIEILKQPLYQRDSNPGLIAKLEAMVVEIDELLEAPDENP